jgi:hypothetical protein
MVPTAARNRRCTQLQKPLAIKAIFTLPRHHLIVGCRSRVADRVA